MRRFMLFAIWSLAAGAASAQQNEAVAFHTDPVEVWGSRFLITVICIGIAVLLFTMFRYRGRTTGAVSWGLLIAGIGIVPITSTGFGTLLVFDRAERVEFCASCHLTMQSFVDDMKNPKSESLAAVHFKNKYIPDNQCYVCHTSYGMFGTVEAKMSGMVDVYKYYTRTFHKPIKMREAYPNHDCLKCHAESAKWLQHDEHIQAKADQFADKMKCLDCHGGDHPAHTINEKVAMR
jgi:nitrate/TMAO reductase-like tetraheme cytochrome c subunit